MAFEPAAGDEPTAYAERRVLLPPILTGDAVLELRGLLLELAADRGIRTILVDCGGVEELAPYAMTVLIAASRTARSHGGALELRDPNAVVGQALDRLGLHKVLAVVGG